MAYRDDLEAAHARIEALEAQLAAVGFQVEDTPELQRRIAALEAKIATVQQRANATQAHFDRLAAALAGAPTTMPTVVEHNRSITPDEDALFGAGAGVRCPWCLALAGDSVEMLVGNTLRLGIFVGAKAVSSDTDSTCVRCPRCNHLALLRAS
ncbi:MAG TPA: hypothetical protein VGI70_14450 [Polyangiales bacterium]